MIAPISCYKGNIEIPSIDPTNTPNASRVGKSTKLNDFIDEYEMDALSQSLGFALNDDFQSNLEVVSGQINQTIKADADQKWKELFNGKTYQLNGKPAKWRGLIFKEGGRDFSLLAYYVFKNFFENDMTHYGGIGLQIEEAKNAERAYYAPKFVNAHQRFYELTVGHCDDVQKTAGYRSLYQFIRDMNNIDPTTYPNWMPYKWPNINVMGL